MNRADALDGLSEPGTSSPYAPSRPIQRAVSSSTPRARDSPRVFVFSSQMANQAVPECRQPSQYASIFQWHEANYSIILHRRTPGRNLESKRCTSVSSSSPPMRPGEEGIDDDNPLRRMERMTQQPALFEPPPNKMNRLIETGATTRREQQLERNAKFEKLRQMERAMGVDQAQAKANWDRMVHEHEIHKMYHPTALGVSHSPVAFMPNDPMMRCVPADYAWPQSLTNLDTKVPSQKLQYFPDPSGASMATNGLVPPMLGDKGEQFFHSGRAC